jgi:hypothetical protein
MKLKSLPERNIKLKVFGKLLQRRILVSDREVTGWRK